MERKSSGKLTPIPLVSSSSGLAWTGEFVRAVEREGTRRHARRHAPLVRVARAVREHAAAAVEQDFGRGFPGDVEAKVWKRGLCTHDTGAVRG